MCLNLDSVSLSKYRLHLYMPATDMRKGYAGLTALSYGIGIDLRAGKDLVIFRSRNGKSIKMLAYDERGLVLITRRLRDGCFAKIQAIAGDPDRVLTASMVLSYFAEGKAEDNETFSHLLAGKSS